MASTRPFVHWTAGHAGCLGHARRSSRCREYSRKQNRPTHESLCSRKIHVPRGVFKPIPVAWGLCSVRRSRPWPLGPGMTHRFRACPQAPSRLCPPLSLQSGWAESRTHGPRKAISPGDRVRPQCGVAAGLSFPGVQRLPLLPVTPHVGQALSSLREEVCVGCGEAVTWAWPRPHTPVEPAGGQEGHPCPHNSSALWETPHSCMGPWNIPDLTSFQCPPGPAITLGMDSP